MFDAAEGWLGIDDPVLLAEFAEQVTECVFFVHFSDEDPHHPTKSYCRAVSGRAAWYGLRRLGYIPFPSLDYAQD